MFNPDFRVPRKIYASKEKRFINFILDLVGYYIFSFVIGLLIGVLSMLGFDAPLNYILTMDRIGELIFTVIVSLTYFTLFEAITQRTLGKYITKTIVVLEDGSKPSISDAFIRSLCRLIPFEAFSFLGDEGRGWHDSLSETYVVDVEKLKAMKKMRTEIDLIGTKDTHV